MDDQYTLPCFICGKELEPAFKETFDNVYNQPFGGTVFKTHGHYGSTAWDPVGMSEKILELTICDQCLVAGSARVLYVRPQRGPTTYEIESWDPEMEM